MENNNKVESRRGFLKKAAYAVPTIVALGQITNPVTAAAGSFVGGGSSTTGTTPPPSNTGSDSGDARDIFKAR